MVPIQLEFLQKSNINVQRSLTPFPNRDEIRQFSRITVTVDELSDANSLTSGNEALKPFDIVSICPGNAKVFAFACQTAEIDIISFDFTHRIPYNISKKLLDTAVSRGILFEIVYSPMLTCKLNISLLISHYLYFL